MQVLWLLQAGGGVQLCPDAQVDDGMLDVTYIINPPLTQARKSQWRRGVKWLLQRVIVFTVLPLPVSISAPYVLFSAVWQIPTILGDLQNDKRLDGPRGQIRCSWLEVDCPDELQVWIQAMQHSILDMVSSHALASGKFAKGLIHMLGTQWFRPSALQFRA